MIKESKVNLLIIYNIGLVFASSSYIYNDDNIGSISMSASIVELPKIVATAKDNKNGRKVRFGGYYFYSYLGDIRYSGFGTR